MDIKVIWVADHSAFTVQNHTHEFYQLALCRKKGGTITIDGKAYEVMPDTVYLMKKGVMHGMERFDDMRLIEIKFLASGEELIKRLNLLPDAFSVSEFPFMKNMLIQAVKEGLNGKVYCNETASSALKIFFATAIREFIKDLPNENLDSQGNKVYYGKTGYVNNDILILNLKPYIEENIHREITLQELADKVYFTPTYFIRRFKILWGVAPMKLVNKVRIEKAKQLLLNNELSVSQVARKCGYKSLHYFSRAFKQEEGISPTDYINSYAVKGGLNE